MRSFIAVELEHKLRSPLVRLLRERLPRSRDVRWCKENQLHITLKFLGEVDEAVLPQVCDVVAAAAVTIAPFEIKLGGLGCFPSARNPRVFWCGIEDTTGGCARWIKAAESGLAQLGFEPEGRAFTPHITLGRSKSRGGARVIQEVLETVPSPPARTMTVEKVVLFESRLKPTGAEYFPVARAALGGG